MGLADTIPAKIFDPKALLVSSWFHWS